MIIALFPTIFSAMSAKSEKRGYLYVLPAVVLVAVFSYYPFLKAFVSSFFIENQMGELTAFAGLENYKALLANEFFIQSVKTTFLLSVIFIPVNTVLTLLGATLVRRKSRFNEVIGSVYIIPLAFSMSLFALILKQILSPTNSIINRIFHLNVVWLNDRTSALVSIIILCVFLDFALDYVLLLSAFRKIERNIIEASLIDGTNEWQRYFMIELPLIVPTLVMTIFIALKDILLISAPIMLMTEGGPFRSTESVMFYYYIEAFKGHNKATENTISVITVLFSALLLAVYSLIQKRKRHA